MSRYYNGPAGDHFDGERFFNALGAPPKGRRDLLRWLSGRGRTRAKWPQWAPSPCRDHPPARVDGPIWRIAYVGHASFLLQTAGLNILLDPVWSERASPVRFAGPKRVNDPGIAFADLPAIDAVLVSHAHYDHLDVATLSRLAAAHRPRVVTPLGNDAIMRNHDRAIAAEGHDWGECARPWRRRQGDAGADATLVGAKSVRPQHVAVGIVRHRSAGRQDLLRRRFRDTATAAISAMRAPVMARSSSRFCRSAPTSRDGSCAIST